PLSVVPAGPLVGRLSADEHARRHGEAAEACGAEGRGLAGRHGRDSQEQSRFAEHRATIRRTYGGDLVSTWSVLRQSCKPRSPVGLVNQPGNQVSAKNDLALAA